MRETNIPEYWMAFVEKSKATEERVMLAATAALQKLAQAFPISGNAPIAPFSRGLFNIKFLDKVRYGKRCYVVVIGPLTRSQMPDGFDSPLRRRFAAVLGFHNFGSGWGHDVNGKEISFKRLFSK